MLRETSNTKKYVAWIIDKKVFSATSVCLCPKRNLQTRSRLFQMRHTAHKWGKLYRFSHAHTLSKSVSGMWYFLGVWVQVCPQNDSGDFELAECRMYVGTSFAWKCLRVIKMYRPLIWRRVLLKKRYLPIKWHRDKRYLHTRHFLFHLMNAMEYMLC